MIVRPLARAVLVAAVSFSSLAIAGSAQAIPPSEPAAPHLRALTRGDEKVTLTVEPRSDRGSAILGYEARCVRGDDGDTVTAESDTTTIVVTGLQNGRRWRCAARAENEVGWSEWSRNRSIFTSDQKPAPPNAPMTGSVGPLLASPVSGLRVTAFGTGRNGSTITAYQARCELDGTVVESAESRTGDQMVVSPLTTGSEWTCTTRARNAKGWSDWSATGLSYEPNYPFPI